MGGQERGMMYCPVSTRIAPACWENECAWWEKHTKQCCVKALTEFIGKPPSFVCSGPHTDTYSTVVKNDTPKDTPEGSR